MSINQTCPEITFQTIVLDPESSARSRYIPMVRHPKEPLIIKFEEMCCRPPTAPDDEIQISLRWLERISRNVWMVQKL
ncbi:uncharacterized protein N7487_012259 [Penicillium crustosum]|uniref:uncharacterized protein n=1 Tax=Penicillium crustosum TaxID=36656 RepID=UPI0023981AC1|nr:uncharacterized protein N7487_012259 [Penicillium crustosum]KAJ5394618.1 hypothetical protein N7487_012259 [Penicillium crustosum]